MRRRAEFSPRFLRALDSIARHYAQMQAQHPDAGAALDQFLEALELDAIPLLLEQPGLGTAVRLESDGFDESADAALRVAHAARGKPVVARQWRVGDFWLLYVVEADVRLILLSARHERQHAYP